MSESAAHEPQHYGYIDALRGLAFLAVFAVHVRDLVHGLPQPLQDILGRGYAGVQLFYVVSALTLCRSLAARAHDPTPLRAYFLRRLFRIVPMFWCAIGLYFVLDGFGPRWGIPNGLTGRHVVLAALLLHGFDLHALNGVVPGGWSVATEVQFYLLLPPMLSWANSLKRALLLWAATLALSIAALPGLEQLLAPLYPTAQRDLVHQFAFFSLPTQLPVFGTGLILFRLLEPDRAILTRLERWLPAEPHSRALLVGLVVLAIGLPPSLAAWPRLVTTFPGHLGYGVLAALLSYALVTNPFRLLVNPVSRFFGRISYSAYLLHFAALQAVDPLVSPVLTGRPLLHLAVTGAISLGLTATASAVALSVIEQPGIALGRRLIAHLVGKPTTVATNLLRNYPDRRSPMARRSSHYDRADRPSERHVP